jgi:hypothetical protein
MTVRERPLRGEKENAMEWKIPHSRPAVVLTIVVVVFLFTAGAALAASGGKSGPTRLSSEGEHPGNGGLDFGSPISLTLPMTGGSFIAGCIADFFQVPVSDVIALRSADLGFGELAIAYFLAQDGGLTVEDIVAMRQSDMGWGEIALYLGLPPGRHGRNLGLIIAGRSTARDTLPAAARRLSERLEVPPEEIADLLDQGASYGTIIVAYRLAAKAPDVSPEELVAQRLDGTSWGQIKRALRSGTQIGQQVAPSEDPPGRQKQGDKERGNPHTDKGDQGRARGHDKEHGH